MLPSRVSAWTAPSIAVLVVACLHATPSFAADDGAWSRLPPDSTSDPSPRREYVAVYDEPRNRYVIFGGANVYAPSLGSLIGETRALDLGASPAWSPVSVTGPGPRHSPQWGYDPANQRMLIFGGYGFHLPSNWTGEYLYDVWQLALDGTPAWSELVASGPHPTGRLAGASIYDPLRQRFVVFGGTVGATVDVFTLDLSGTPTWSILPVDGTPPLAGYGMTTIYDPKRDRMIMFGGSTSDYYYGVQDKVWELTFEGTPTWKDITPAVAGPCARRTLTSIYDPVRDRMIVFAGWDNLDNPNSFRDDTWALALDGDPQWSELHPAGASHPVGRDAITAAYDSKFDRMVVFGGFSGTQFLNDTWFLNWGNAGDKAILTPTANTLGGHAHVTWDVQSATAPHGAVFRRQEGTPWRSVAVVQQDGAGDLVFDDATVQPGGRYAYLAAVPSEQGTNFGGEVWVDVPSTVGVPATDDLAFALTGAVPNPVGRERFSVTFALPGAAPATLSLHDVAGRAVATREVGALGPGSHTIDFTRPAGLAAGVYFLTLEQAARRATRRVVLLD
jgi:hypothetical protein